MSGKKSRTKGHSYERAIANVFREAGYTDAKRQLEYQEGLGVDLANTGPYRVQCKRYKAYAPITKIEEVPEEVGTVPLLITKADNKPDMVCLSLNHFIELVKDRRKLVDIYTESRKDYKEDK